MCRALFFLYLLVVILSISCTGQKYERIYFDDETLKFECKLKDGLKHGKSVEYYSNGEIKVESLFVNGVEEGMLKYYDSLGNLLRVYSMIDGVEEGGYKIFFPSGKLKREGVIAGNKEDGLTSVYYEDGLLNKRIFFNEGNFYYLKSYLENGQMYDCKLPFNVTRLSKNDFQFQLLYSDHHIDSVGVGVVLGRFDSNFVLEDTFDISTSKGMVVKVEIEEGIDVHNVLQGYVLEIEKPENRIDGNFTFKIPLDSLQIGRAYLYNPLPKPKLRVAE